MMMGTGRAALADVLARHGREGLLKYTESQTIAVRSALAEKLQTPGTDAVGYAKRFTKLLKAAKLLPR